ncbi:MAG TPA: hypothetical protein VN174_02770 [Candidatus Methanoperedens sp.]|nr:hypothetical protein [Candidatus Methanoperedens sp.]
MSSIESINLHIRTYRSALKGNLEVTVSSLSNSYLKIESILHPLAADPTRLDASAIVYSFLRLPKIIDQTKIIVMGQSPQVFAHAGFQNVTSWKKVPRTVRRRSRYFDSKNKICASFISSISDVDDIVNLVLAYQIEWNKFHSLITHTYPSFTTFKKEFINNPEPLDGLKLINLSLDDWNKVKIALGKNWRLRLKKIYSHPQNLRLRLLAASWIDYTKTTQQWWQDVTSATSKKFNFSTQNIYFVSSNSHAFQNLITGFAKTSEKNLMKLAPQNYEISNPYLSHQDFLYYLSRFFNQDKKYQSNIKKIENQLGVATIPSAHHLEINTQIFPVSSLFKTKNLDSRLKISNQKKLQNSKALIFNIDYPLGYAAYHVLSKVLENTSFIKGVYILGKAAVLNSEIGDLQIPRLVFDEHSQSSFIFNNCFNSFFPFKNRQGSILTNQKSVSVFGTFLENESLLKKYSQNDLTLIEMESGPYLSAISEATYDSPTPRGSMVDLNSAPFDIGIINYTSDTPYSKAKNLGAGALNLAGIEPVYLGSLAILQRIIDLEEQG